MNLPFHPARALLHFALITLSIAPLLGHAACPDAAAVATFVEDVKAVRANHSFSKELSLQEAECARGKLIAALPAVLGKQVGYFAAFTNPTIRGMMRFDEPVWGAIFDKELQSSPAKLPVRFGAVTYWNPNLLVVVKDAKLADAKTPLQALSSISAVIPYIGLEDLMTESSLSREHFVAINGGFRGGVLGKRIPVTANKRFADALAKMEVITTADGVIISKVSGSVLMDGHPLDSAIWLARVLRTNGITLKEGDLLALGSFAMSQSPRQNNSISVKYAGIPGNPSLAVKFD